MPRTNQPKRAGQRQSEYRAAILTIELPRRDVHDLALVRRRLYELTVAGRFLQAIELEFVLSIVDGLFRRVENARKTKGFTWNDEASEEDGLGQK